MTPTPFGRARRVAAIALALGAPAGAAAQACGLAGGTGAEAAAGYMRYELGSGTSGPAFGGDLTVGTHAFAARAGYRRLLLDSAPDPDVGRLAIAVRVVDILGVSVCPVAHGGLSRVTLGDDAAEVVVGGIGLRVAAAGRLGAVAATPFAEVRGFAANTTGTVYGAEVDAVGYSLGGAAGVRMTAGVLTFRVEGALDGLDDGLGPTPYPNQSVELGIGVRF